MLQTKILLLFLAILSGSAGLVRAAEDRVDGCDTADNFFLFPGEKSVSAPTSMDGMVELRKSKPGDGFSRWSMEPSKPMPLTDANRWLSIRFGKFSAPGTAVVVYAVFYRENKRLAQSAVGTIQGGPGALVADLKHLNAQATHFSLLFRHAKNPRGVAKIDEIRLGAGKPKTPASTQNAVVKNEPLPPLTVQQVKVELATGNSIPVVAPGNEGAVALVLTNPGGQRMDLAIRLVIDDYHHNERTLAREISLGAGSTASVAPLFDGKTYGVYTIDYTLTDRATGDTARGFKSFCYMQPAGPTPYRREGFLFGVNGGAEIGSEEEDLRNAARAMALAGIKVMRGALYWEALQYRGPNRWVQKRIDDFSRILDILKENGIEVQMLLGYNTPWNMPPGIGKHPEQSQWQFNPPQKGDMQRWLGYVNKMVQTFGDRVRYWEVWNEADLWGFWHGSSGDYLTLLEATSKTIKSHSPDHRVMTSGFALIGGHGGHHEEDFQKKVCIQGRPFYDILAHHQHGRTDEFYRAVDGGLAEIRKRLDPPAPLWFNETADSNPKDGYRYQAAALARKLLFAWSRGAMGYTWYEMRAGTLEIDSKERWGLMSQGLEPKYAYGAYNTLVLLLDDKDFAAELNRGADRYGFVFRQRDGGGQYVVGLWDESEKLNEEPVAFAVGSGTKAFAVDLMGNRRPLAVTDGVAVIHSGLYPRFLLVEGAAKAPTLLKPLVAMDSPLPIAVPGRPFELPVQLHNPLRADAKINVSLSNLPGKASGPPATPTRAGRRSNEQIFAIAVPADFRLPYGDLHPMTLSYTVPGANWSGAIRVPIEPAVLVPERGMDERPPDVVLEDDRYVTNLHENAPERMHLTWQGTDDLSARIWLGRDATNLRVRVDVRDDRHNANLDNLGDADSVGLVLYLPQTKTNWVIYCARSNQGRSMGKVLGSTRSRESPQIDVITTPRDGALRYDIKLPFSRLGITDAILVEGIRLNVIVVDRDQKEREGWIQIAPPKVPWWPNRDASTFRTFMFAASGKQ